MKMIDALKEIVSIESVAGEAEGIYPYGRGPAMALDKALEIAEAQGFRTHNADYRYGYAEIGEGEELIVILGHLDVVPAGDGWNTLPYEATEIDGRVYGRGTIDDKGPMIAAMYAMKDVLDSGINLSKRIRILFGQSEENGENRDIEAYIAEEGLPTCGFTPDSDFPAIYGEKGLAIIKISMPLELSGIDSAKGGNAPNMVPDACTLVIGDKIYEGKGASAHGSMPWDGVNGIEKTVELVTESNCEFVNMYRNLFANDHHGVKANIGFEDEASGKLSVNPGMVFSDDEEVTLLLDVRYPVTYDAEQVVDALNEALLPYGANASLDFGMNKVYMDKNGPVITALKSAYRDVTGDESEPIVIGGATYARQMNGIIAFGPVTPGMVKTEHMANEYVDIDHMELMRKVYSSALVNLLNL